MALVFSQPDLAERNFQFTISRNMECRPEKLYRAWTAQLDRWFAAPGSVLMKAEIDSPFYFETTFDGKRHPHYGRFLRLEPNRLIEMTWITAATRGAETVITIEFASENGKTELRLNHSGFADESSKEQHEQAWPGVLAELDRRMAQTT